MTNNNEQIFNETLGKAQKIVKLTRLGLKTYHQGRIELAEVTLTALKAINKNKPRVYRGCSDDVLYEYDEWAYYEGAITEMMFALDDDKDELNEIEI